LVAHWIREQLLGQAYIAPEDLNLVSLCDSPAEVIQIITDFNGTVFWNHDKPDGMNKKQLDTTVINKLDWNPKIDLVNGIRNVYNEYLNE
jgi:nucleoside-diphosphate-sugar epimerase